MVAPNDRHVSKLARISPTKIVLIFNLTSDLNETLTHECISEKCLLLPLHPQQLAASKNPKSSQNNRNIVRDSHDSNRMSQNGLDTSQIQPRPGGARYSSCFHYHMVRMRLALVSPHPRVETAATIGVRAGGTGGSAVPSLGNFQAKRSKFGH